MNLKKIYDVNIGFIILRVVYVISFYNKKSRINFIKGKYNKLKKIDN